MASTEAMSLSGYIVTERKAHAVLERCIQRLLGPWALTVCMAFSGWMAQRTPRKHLAGVVGTHGQPGGKATEVLRKAASGVATALAAEAWRSVFYEDCGVCVCVCVCLHPCLSGNSMLLAGM